VSALRSPPALVGSLLGNVAARVAGLGCVFAATLILAHDGGPAAVGVYALLHVLPGLIGTIVSAGLPVAAPYFLAGPKRDDARLPSTLVTMALVGGAFGAALWVVAAPLIGPLLFPDLSLALVMLAGAAVMTRLVVITAKACSQGAGDLRGSNLVILVEQLNFLPAYGVLWILGVHQFAAVVGALLLADAATAALAWVRLARRRFLARATRPDLGLAREIAAYGLRAQTGGVISQLNLRLDFVLLTLLTGPAVLGVYAVASKFAELIRIVGMALTYVFYPEFARNGRVKAIADARRLLPKAAALSAGCFVPLWITAGFVIPVFYGSRFDSAVTPARIILFGLALEGVAGIITGLLYGAGRPGLNSWAMGAGLAVTIVLDLMLIPSFGAIGAATASAIAYGTSTATLVWFFLRLERRQRVSSWADARLSAADAG
jgi:O-antigen/teichoic acid export membrane protein